MAACFQWQAAVVHPHFGVAFELFPRRAPAPPGWTGQPMAGNVGTLKNHARSLPTI